MLNEVGTPQLPALGFLELSSISRGLYLTDIALKKAPIRIIASQPISSGKHVLLFAGSVAEVQESYHAALAQADGTLVKQVLIPGIHEQLAPFLDSLWAQSPKRMPVADAAGIVESTTLSGAILAADAALKSANVSLCRLRLGQGIGGKAFFVITGRQEDVEAALECAQTELRELDSLFRVDLIANPQDEALQHL